MTLINSNKNRRKQLMFYSKAHKMILCRDNYLYIQICNLWYVFSFLIKGRVVFCKFLKHKKFSGTVNLLPLNSDHCHVP